MTGAAQVRIQATPCLDAIRASVSTRVSAAGVIALLNAFTVVAPILQEMRRRAVGGATS